MRYPTRAEDLKEWKRRIGALRVSFDWSDPNSELIHVSGPEFSLSNEDVCRIADAVVARLRPHAAFANTVWAPKPKEEW